MTIHHKIDLVRLAFNVALYATLAALGLFVGMMIDRG